MRRTLALLDGRAVAGGTAVALAVAVPTLAAGVILDPGDESNVVLLLYGLVMLGFTLGGLWAARHRPDAPFANGAAAALAAYAAIALVASIIRLARGRSVEPVPLLFNAFMAATFGIIGGLLSGRPRPTAGERSPRRRRS
ncbi:MAG TPA: hypothetical protein VG078_04330 [Acidimicrobiales bacterium]|nr:hypothetical protein [Acidimicrobiales bacterium]